MGFCFKQLRSNVLYVRFDTDLKNANYNFLMLAQKTPTLHHSQSQFDNIE